MTDIATWRARIGLYNLSTGGPSGRRVKVLRPSSTGAEWSLLLALTTSAENVVTLIIIGILLMLAGDVERNPGPGKVADVKTAVYGVFRSHFDQLVSAVTQPVALAGRLYARELINRDMNNEIITLPVSDANKAARLMSAVEATMEADPDPAQVLRKLCEAMEDDDPTLKHLAITIRAALAERGGNWEHGYRDRSPLRHFIDQPAPAHAAALASLTPGLHKFIDYLKDCYISRKSPPLLKESSLVVRPKEYIHLNLVSTKEEEEEEVKTDCLMLQLHGDVKGIKKKRKPIEIGAVGKSEDQSVPRRILVEGAPGIGKTMFAWELCRQWAQGEVLRDWAMVLILQLRSEVVREAKSLLDLFQNDDCSIKEEDIECIKSTGGRGLFLIFEGYDELAEHQKKPGSIFQKLLAGDCLLKATIMVTSRPFASSSLCPEFREGLDQHIEIVGFTDKDITSYVESACKRQHRTLLADLLSYISSNPFVASVMYIPLQCAILTALYIQNWKKKGKSYAPSTLTDLYTDLLLSLLKRYINDHPVYKEQKCAIQQLSDLPAEVQKQVWKLSRLAAEGLENRRYIFDSAPCDTMGLMQGAEEELVLSSSVSYCFLHLTLQEYLAALHWSKMDSKEMARMVTESDLFPLETLVFEGIENTAGFHWPALFFLAGLTKLMSVPIQLLKSSLTAGEPIGADEDDAITQRYGGGLKHSSDRFCNPYFFQLLFEAHSTDLVARVFAGEKVVAWTETPLESFVTAWSLANSDTTSVWYLVYENTSLLGQLQKELKNLDCLSTGHKHGRIAGLSQLNGDISETIIQLPKLHPCTQDMKLLVVDGNMSVESKEVVQLPLSLLPSLEAIRVQLPAEDVAHMLPSLSRLHELTTLKSVDVALEEDNLQTLSLPLQHCPSLLYVCLIGPASSFLFPSLVLPNISTLEVLMIDDCPLTSADLSGLCSGLCQSTTFKHLELTNIKMETSGAKELAAALEQNTSLEHVFVKDETISYEDSRALEAVLKNHTTVEDYKVEKL